MVKGRCRPLCYVLHTLSISQGCLSREVLETLWYELFIPAIGSNCASNVCKMLTTLVSIATSKTARSSRVSAVVDHIWSTTTPPTQTVIFPTLHQSLSPYVPAAI